MIHSAMVCVFGAVLLYLGSEFLIRGSASLSLRLKIAPLVIGLTVLAFSTSSPELFVSGQAALQGHGGLSLGNIVGSSLFTVGGILAICAIIRPLPLKPQLVRWDLPCLLISYLALGAFVLYGQIPRWGGGVFLLCLIVYTVLIYRTPKASSFIQKEEIVQEVGVPFSRIEWDLFLMAGGLAFLFIGSDLFVKGSLGLAKNWGMSESTIGLSLVALGTSLPELGCSLVALRRKRFDLLIGNIIGSNLFNVFCVMGISALLRPIQVQGVSPFDLALLIFSALLLFPFRLESAKLSRLRGIVLFALYCGYLGFLLSR